MTGVPSAAFLLGAERGLEPGALEVVLDVLGGDPVAAAARDASLEERIRERHVVLSEGTGVRSRGVVERGKRRFAEVGDRLVESFVSFGLFGEDDRAGLRRRIRFFEKLGVRIGFGFRLCRGAEAASDMMPAAQSESGTRKWPRGELGVVICKGLRERDNPAGVGGRVPRTAV
jgi:hypothetical protein